MLIYKRKETKRNTSVNKIKNIYEASHTSRRKMTAIIIIKENDAKQNKTNLLGVGLRTVPKCVSYLQATTKTKITTVNVTAMHRTNLPLQRQRFMT